MTWWTFINVVLPCLLVPVVIVVVALIFQLSLGQILKMHEAKHPSKPYDNNIEVDLSPSSRWAMSDSEYEACLKKEEEKPSLIKWLFWD